MKRNWHGHKWDDRTDSPPLEVQVEWALERLGIENVRPQTNEEWKDYTQKGFLKDRLQTNLTAWMNKSFDKWVTLKKNKAGYSKPHPAVYNSSNFVSVKNWDKVYPEVIKSMGGDVKTKVTTSVGRGRLPLNQLVKVEYVYALKEGKHKIVAKEYLNKINLDSPGELGQIKVDWLTKSSKGRYITAMKARNLAKEMKKQ